MTMRDSRSMRLSRREALGLLGASAGLGVATVLREELGFAQAPVAGWLTATSASPVTFPKGAIIRTILKDVPPQALASGATMFHEHLGGSYVSPSPPSAPYVEGRETGVPARGAQAAPPPQPPPETSIDLMVDEVKQAGKD